MHGHGTFLTWQAGCLPHFVIIESLIEGDEAFVGDLAVWQYDLGRSLRASSIRILTWVAWSIFFAPITVVSAGQPSGTEQLWLQIVNRFRASPAEELDRLVNYREQGTGLAWGVPISDHPLVADNLEFFRVDPAVLRAQFQQLRPAPPLVWSEQLHDSAEYYSQVMIQRDQQSHTLDQYTGVFGLLDRLQAEGGYDFSGGGGAAENLFAFAEDVIHGHAALALDWGARRRAFRILPAIATTC